MNEEQILEAIKLYQDDKLSLWDISARIGVKYNILRKILKNRTKIRYSGETSRVTTPEQEENIKNDYITGLSIRKLMLKYDVDRSVINRVLREKKVKLRDILESNRKKEFDVNKIIEMYNSGESCSGLGRIFNTTALTITRILRKNNIEIKNSHKPYFQKSHNLEGDIEKEIIHKYVNENYSCGELSREYCNGDHCQISKLLTRNGITIVSGRIKSQKYSVDESYFESINTPAKAFIFGLMITDGCVIIKDRKYRITIELQAEDKHVLEFIKSELKSTHPIYRNEKKNTYIFHISNKKMAIDLSNLGCMPNKTYKLTFPISVPEYLFSHFLHGCIMGDGSIYKTKDRPTVLFLGTHDLIIKTKEYLNKLGFEGCIHNHEESQHISELTYNGKDSVLRMLTYIYDNAPFIMIRKFKKFEEILLDRKAEDLRFDYSYPILEKAEKVYNDIKLKFKDLLDTKT